MPRLPIPGSDEGKWGDILNEYLRVEHNDDGTQKTLTIAKGGTNATSASAARTNLDVMSVAEVSDLVTAHEADTTSIHGIADTANLMTKGELVINVKDYGAIGNGTADDTVAIQAAIDAANGTGRRVMLPAGKIFRITDTLTLGSNFSLYGPGATIKPEFATPKQKVIQNDWINGGQNIALIGFKLDRSHANCEHGILLNGVTNLLLDGLELIGFGAAYAQGAVAISGVGPTTRLLSENVRVTNCLFRDVNNFGIQIGYVRGCVVEGNTFTNCFREAIGVEPEAGNFVEAVTIIANSITTRATGNGSTTGLLIVTGTSGGTVRDCAVIGNTVVNVNSGNAQPGISIVACSKVVVQGNVVRGMDGHGIQVGLLGAAVSDIICANNVIEDCSASGLGVAKGIRLADATHCLIQGNIIRGLNHQYAIAEEGSSGNNAIISNRLIGNAAPISYKDTSLVAGNATVSNDKSWRTTGLVVGYDNQFIPSMVVNGIAGTTRTIGLDTAGVARWRLRANGTVESGSNVGSDLELLARDDSGNNIGTVFIVTRADRAFRFTAPKLGFYNVTPVAKPTALTAIDASTIDTTYGTEEANVMANLRTRLNELEQKLKDLGLLS